MIQFCPAEVCVFICRRLTAQQKALILAYAETESGVDGTVNGIASTKDGRISLPISCVFSVSQKKNKTWGLYHSFSKYRPIFKILIIRLPRKFAMYFL